MNGGRQALGGLSSDRPAASRGARELISVRFTPQDELQPIQHPQPRFDPRDFATSVFVIVFFALVFVAPLVLLGAVALRFIR